MKRLVSIGLLFLLVFQVGGYFSVFRLLQSGIRQEVMREIEAGVEPGSLVELVIPTDPAQAARLGYTLIRNREIIFEGMYYDIVRSEPAGTDTRYFCFADKKESRLAWQMNENGREGKTDQAGLVQQIMSLTLLAYLGEYVIITECPGSDRAGNTTDYFFSVITWEPLLTVPPPRMIV